MNRDLPHLKNFRDFAGYRCRDGAVLCGGVFARSDNQRFVTEKEIAALKDRGFTTVIDLRRDYEPLSRPDLLAAAEGFSHHLITMYTTPYSEMSHLTTAPQIAAFFMECLRGSAPCISRVFRLFAASDSGVMFHCESGKDRTGLIAALLLILCDVEEETIVEDYRMSYDAMYYGADPALLNDPVMIPMAETMERFLALFCRAYPDPKDYFRSIGLTEIETERIRRKLRMKR